MKWKNIPHAKGYVAEVHQEDELILKKKTFKPQISIDLAPGAYQFRIRSIDQRGRNGPWGEFRPLKVGAIPPLLVTPPRVVPLEVLPQYEILSWKEAPLADHYQIRIWRGGEKLVDTEVDDTSYEFSIQKEGTYRFSVASVYKDILGPFSPTQKFKAKPISIRDIAALQTNLYQEDDFESSFTLTPLVGVSSLQYKESGSNTYSALLFTPAARARVTFSPSIDLTGGFFFNFGSIVASAESSPFQLIGVDLAPGISFGSLPWRFRTRFGLMYLNTSTRQGYVGFTDLIGPLLSFRLSRWFSNGHSLSAGLEYASLEEIGDIQFNPRSYFFSFKSLYTFQARPAIQPLVQIEYVIIRTNAGGVPGTGQLQSATLSVGGRW